ncbi:hypothetical protein [Polycladidibacter hongkongensis]|uniref:hypothetical protein n=1 Tax=Polycladidibacter hongkongensis TaxID=1647556 RepID=UPI0008295D9A|nr:hypothetical protein [Pseudovibrio hongkongensis]
MVSPLTAALADFTNDNPLPVNEAQELKEIVSRLPKSYGDGDDWINRVFEAYEDGVSDGKKEVQEAADGKIEKMQQELQETLATERSAFKAGEGQQLEMELASAIAQIEAKVAADVAAILAPFMHEQARARAVQALATILRRHLSAAEHPLITVRGPAELFGMFKEKGAANGARIDFIETDDADLHVEVGEMHLSTGLNEFSANLATALEGQD